MKNLYKLILLAVVLLISIVITATSNQITNNYWNINTSAKVTNPELITSLPEYPYSDIYRIIDYQTGKIIYISTTNRGSTHQTMSVVDLNHK